ncbi:MAG: peptide deformylase [Pelagibacteraceae bacterium]|nr:peptide deformylase [Pelagibacteraceae bacterium]MCI5079765.1 peptide deformylase [Pelagibacteraceae bacterium]
MSVLEILKEPDPILRKKSDEVSKVDNDIRALMDNMLETMYQAPGIGLAAPQVGILKKVIVIDLAKEDEPKKPLFIVNPKIIWKSDELSSREEGCLSIPGYFAEVVRPTKCKLQYLDYDGEQQEIEAEDLLSTCIQHEVDHCDGVLFIDYLSKLKKDMIIKKLIKAKKEQQV